MTRSEKLRARYGPWAVVTGASEGIGRAFARELAAAGFDLVLVARREAALTALAQELQDGPGVRCEVIALNLAADDATARLLAATAALDVGLLVAAAGFGTSGEFLDMEVAADLAMVELNISAVVEQTHGFGRRLATRGRGGLVLMSSLLAFQGIPRAAAYAATKAFVQVFAEGLQREKSLRGVDVMAVAPGPIASGFAARAGMTMSAAGTPEQVARGALAALGRKGTVRPGFLSWFLEGALAPLPRVLRSRIMGQAMAGMTKAA